jgi:hypothetical protein
VAELPAKAVADPNSPAAARFARRDGNAYAACNSDRAAAVWLRARRGMFEVMTVLSTIALVLVLVLAAAALGRSPTWRLWNRTRPGEPGAVDPTGSPMPNSHEFERPRNEGDLL